LYRIVNLIRRQVKIDWAGWNVKRVEEVLEFFIRKKLCKRIDGIEKQYIHLSKKFYTIEINKKKILSAMMNQTPGLKVFMALHSAFKVDAYKEGDWLERFMIEKLILTDEEVYNLLHPEPVPQDILDKFKMFEPEQILFTMDLIRIEYGMWQKGHNGRLVDPINIIHTDFDNIEIVKREDIIKKIAKYNCIEAELIPVSDEEWSIEDDLPF